MLLNFAFSTFCFLIIFFYYKYKERKLILEKIETIQTIENLSKFIALKAQVVNNEYFGMFGWLEEAYPAEILEKIINDPQVQDLKDRSHMTDDQFYTAIQSVIIDVVIPIRERLLNSKNKIDDTMKQDLKNFLTENKS